MLISLTQYANLHGKDASYTRRKAAKGHFHSAKKIGRNWVIDSDEPYFDKRLKKQGN